MADSILIGAELALALIRITNGVLLQVQQQQGELSPEIRKQLLEERDRLNALWKDLA